MLHRNDITYLAYITSEANLGSILDRGILSNRLAAHIPHHSVADPEVQARRAKKRCGGRNLHEYANLYFWARNAMMYRVRDDEEVCVVRVSAAVLDLPGVHYTSRNAAVGDSTFHAVDGPEFPPLVKEHLYSGSWVSEGVKDNNRMEIMQAEVLVPDLVTPNYIDAVYARSDEQATRIRLRHPGADVRVHTRLFFNHNAR